MIAVRTMAEFMASGETPDVLFWVGCAGSFDQRAQKVTKAFAQILNKVGVNFAILGKEEMCTGDPARRSGNEFLFQMMAYNNIQVLNGYEIKKLLPLVHIVSMYLRMSIRHWVVPMKSSITPHFYNS